MQSTKKIIYNGKVLTPEGWLENAVVAISDGKITGISKDSALVKSMAEYNEVVEEIAALGNAEAIGAMEKGVEMIDAKGGFVMPGGIDLHVHGAAGHDFMEATPEAFDAVIKAHRAHGTTSMFPTIASASPEILRESAKVCSELMTRPESGVLGLHYEGPYFNRKMAGGQMAEYMRDPDKEEYEALVEEFPCISRWDVSPELPGSEDFARCMVQHNVVAGLAHTQSDYPTVKRAHEAGITFATHFYNAMSSAHKVGIFKHEGTVESVFLLDGINVEVIADGIHVPPTMVRMIHKFKGTDRMCLVTDALSCTASDSKTAYDPRIIIEDGVCMLSDRSAIAGSVATMDRLIRTTVQKAGIPLEEVSRMVSATPARIMGVYDRKGSLEAGKDADIIIMDADLSLTHVFSMGQSHPVATLS